MQSGSRHRHDSLGAIWVALALSVLLHLPVILILAALKPTPGKLERTNFDAKRAFSVDVLAEDAREKKKEKKKKKPQTEDNLQYVSFPRPDKQERPDKAHLADRWDSKTQKEMVHKALPGSHKPAQPLPRPVQEPSPKNAKGDTHADQKKNQPPRDSVEDGVEARKESAEASPSPRPVPRQLFPSLTDPKAARMLGDGGSLDYLRDVPEGDKTLLNRKHTRYWAFFDRVKRQVSKEWSPVTQYRKHDPYGNVYGVKDRYSTVDVTLNGDGSVRRLYLSRGSGLDFFDDEAVRAIQTAAPFYNPPEGLKDEDGLIHFTFGFYFEINSGRFRFMRVFN